MADKEKELPNVEVLREHLLKGEKVRVGDVLAKTDYDPKGEKAHWGALCNTKPAKLKETGAPVGKAKKAGAKGAAAPGA